MRKILSIAALVTIAMSASAQDTYLDAQLTTQADVIGTARYVGMGGAMGALGADISTISSNPAGIAMMKKMDITFTAGGVWQNRNTGSVYGYQPAHATVDQAGFVAPFKINETGLVNFNVAFNYQKKIDYNQAFAGDLQTQASWAHELNNMSDAVGITSDYSSWGTDGRIYGAAYEGNLYPSNTLVQGHTVGSCASGYMGSYDFNLSANFINRYFFGLTFGIDNVRFDQRTDYYEYRNDATDASINQGFRYVNDQWVRGTGYNLKFGFIARPFETKSLRIGLTVETPTWFKLSYNDYQTIATNWIWDKATEKYVAATPSEQVHYANRDINYMDFKIFTPWKFRFQLGGTVGSNLALGMEYEYAMYDQTSLRYPNAGYRGSFRDDDMNAWTEACMKGQHTLRLGAEFKPTSNISLRLGYNAISRIYTDGAYWDPRDESVNYAYSIDYPTSLQYMNLKNAHIVTAGIGYRFKHVYFDLAYKCRIQNADYYAFNSYNSVDNQTGLKINMPAIPVNLTRHSIVATIGVRF